MPPLYMMSVHCSQCFKEIPFGQKYIGWWNFGNGIVTNSSNFQDFLEIWCEDCFRYGVPTMPKATLSYEALATDTEGNVTEGAYRLKLEGNFKQYIEPMVVFIKSQIPSSDRTYEPQSREWFYHEKWHPLMEQAFKGSHYSVVYGVTKEAFTELKRKQSEWAKQAGQNFQTRTYDTNQDLEQFASLIAATSINVTNGAYKTWSRDEAIAAYKKAIRFYHPDLHPERAEQASSLNEIWSRLKEGYYIK